MVSEVNRRVHEYINQTQINRIYFLCFLLGNIFFPVIACQTGKVSINTMQSVERFLLICFIFMKDLPFSAVFPMRLSLACSNPYKFPRFEPSDPHF